MRRVVIVVSAIALVLALTGCGKSVETLIEDLDSGKNREKTKNELVGMGDEGVYALAASLDEPGYKPSQQYLLDTAEVYAEIQTDKALTELAGMMITYCTDPVIYQKAHDLVLGFGERISPFLADQLYKHESVAIRVLIFETLTEIGDPDCVSVLAQYYSENGLAGITDGEADAVAILLRETGEQGVSAFVKEFAEIKSRTVDDNIALVKVLLNTDTEPSIEACARLIENNGDDEFISAFCGKFIRSRIGNVFATVKAMTRIGFDCLKRYIGFDDIGYTYLLDNIFLYISQKDKPSGKEMEACEALIGGIFSIRSHKDALRYCESRCEPVKAAAIDKILGVDPADLFGDLETAMIYVTSKCEPVRNAASSRISQVDASDQIEFLEALIDFTDREAALEAVNTLNDDVFEQIFLPPSGECFFDFLQGLTPDYGSQIAEYAALEGSAYVKGSARGKAIAVYKDSDIYATYFYWMLPAERRANSLTFEDVSTVILIEVEDELYATYKKGDVFLDGYVEVYNISVLDVESDKIVYKTQFRGDKPKETVTVYEFENAVYGETPLYRIKDAMRSIPWD